MQTNFPETGLRRGGGTCASAKVCSHLGENSIRQFQSPCIDSAPFFFDQEFFAARYGLEISLFTGRIDDDQQNVGKRNFIPNR
ncbi:MAG: hypothetical protein RLZZ519_1828 [Bacteroidota bacterium]